MIYVEKSKPAPACLEIEKQKKNGDYKCGDVLSRIKMDFRNKCYLCENKAPTSINVEHFQSHQGNKNLMFDWYNLFYSCAHCNNIKLALYDYILNCTDMNDRVDEWIYYEIESFPKEIPKLTALHDDIRVHKTVELLEKIYNGRHTRLKKIEAGNLRQKVLEEVEHFRYLLEEYQHEDLGENYRRDLKNEIKRCLSPYAPFTAFKKWIIRDNEVLHNDFSEFICYNLRRLKSSIQ